ncbi:MAG: InlB B-repeat-containing protein [Clostridia bacterium]|nr:InlB B-repeat-containing protein [Clostridia bacterium]
MKNKIFVAGLFVTAAFATLAACGETQKDEHNFVLHEGISAGCETAGNDAYYTCDHCDKVFNAEKQEITEIPAIPALGHNYKYNEGQAGTCSTKGVISHYTCDDCDGLFDAAKNKITSVESGLDEANHSSDLSISVTSQPTKTAYYTGETFDPTGMVVVSKCDDCEGKNLDNQLLKFEYQTEGATAFSLGDTKVTVKYQDLSQEVEITVSQKQAQILGLAESYQTVCGVAPVIEATSDVGEIVVEYYDGETLVQPTDFVADKTYVAKLTVEGTDAYLGAEATANITVAHAHEWKEDDADWKKLGYECTCGDKKSFSLLQYQTPYVDETHQAIDLSKFVVGTEDFSITSVKQIVRMKDGKYELEASKGELADIDCTVDGSVYTFALDKYEQPSADVKPYILTLSVTYEIEGIERAVIVEAKLVDKVITEAKDLALLAYEGDPNDAGGEKENYYYVLGQDIDASGVEITNSNACWKQASGFVGTFDGNGYTVSNLKITGGQGLFGALGENAKVQNVKFENLNVKEGLYAFAFCARASIFTNVTVEFSLDSGSYSIAYSANGCTFEKFNVLMNKNAGVPFLIDENANNALPETVNVSYFAFFNVTFNSNGGSEVAPVAVLQGEKLTAPATPTKYSEDYDYNFLGWFLNETDETPFDFNSEITGDLTLIAKWEQTEKTNVLLNAKSQTLTKWDYGNAITVTNGTDETYGDVWNVTIDDIVEQSITHTAINTSDYAKVYFYVYNPTDVEIRLVVHGGYGAWGQATIMLPAKTWTKVELDMSVFEADQAGQIFLMLQVPDAGSLAGEWKISSFYGSNE